MDIIKQYIVDAIVPFKKVSKESKESKVSKESIFKYISTNNASIFTMSETGKALN